MALFELADYEDDLSFESFKYCRFLNMTNYKEIIEFYKLQYNENFSPFYHTLPAYNSICGDSRFRYRLFTINNDRVFVAFEIVQIVTTKQIRIIGYPISETENTDNEKLILLKLLELDFVRVAMAEKLFGDLSYDRCFTYDDYFIDLSQYNFNCKFKSKYGITKLLKNSDFEIHLFVGNDSSKFVPKLVQLYDTWEFGMDMDGHEVSSENRKTFIKFLLSDRTEVVKIILCYKNIPISLQLLLIDPVLKVQDLLYIVHWGRRGIDAPDVKTIFNSLSEIQVYLLKYALDKQVLLNNIVYIAGCRPTEKRLLKHKQNISTGCITYGIS